MMIYYSCGRISIETGTVARSYYVYEKKRSADLLVGGISLMLQYFISFCLS